MLRKGAFVGVPHADGIEVEEVLLDCSDSPSVGKGLVVGVPLADGKAVLDGTYVTEGDSVDAPAILDS